MSQAFERLNKWRYIFLGIKDNRFRCLIKDGRRIFTIQTAKFKGKSFGIQPISGRKVIIDDKQAWVSRFKELLGDNQAAAQMTHADALACLGPEDNAWFC